MASHPKIAHARPRAEYEKAQTELLDARAELQAAMAHARRCQLVEGEALATWIAVNPSPSQDEVFRDKIAKENAARLERVNGGLPADPPSAPKVGKSPIDQAFANRGKNKLTGLPAARPVLTR
jgi:hypothetical protein